MVKSCIRFDLRTPSFGPPAEEIYAAAIDMIEYADSNGFDIVKISEHHNIADGYLPSPLLIGAAAAARSRRIIIEMYIIAPLYEPIRLAEDLAVLDRLSGGRVRAVMVAGYRPSEFAMFGQDLKARGRRMEEIIDTLRHAWRGERFDFDGHSIEVTPRPLRRDGPPLYMGGSFAAAAKRAARIADGFLTHLPELHQIYVEEAQSLGRVYNPWESHSPSFVHVTRTPDEDWKRIARSALHETNSYAQWGQDSGVDPSYTKAQSADELKATGAYAVVTPDQALEMARNYDQLILHPLLAGTDPALGWSSLKLFVAEVLPRI